MAYSNTIQYKTKNSNFNKGDIVKARNTQLYILVSDYRQNALFEGVVIIGLEDDNNGTFSRNWSVDEFELFHGSITLTQE